MFFSLYTPEPYYPARHEVKNTFRVAELALEQIRNNSGVIELAFNAADIRRIAAAGRSRLFWTWRARSISMATCWSCARCTAWDCGRCNWWLITTPTISPTPAATSASGGLNDHGLQGGGRDESPGNGDQHRARLGGDNSANGGGE